MAAKFSDLPRVSLNFFFHFYWASCTLIDFNINFVEFHHFLSRWIAVCLKQFYAFHAMSRGEANMRKCSHCINVVSVIPTGRSSENYTQKSTNSIRKSILKSKNNKQNNTFMLNVRKQKFFNIKSINSTTPHFTFSFFFLSSQFKNFFHVFSCSIINE